MDRAFIKDKNNLIGLKEKLQTELNLKDEDFDDKQFSMYIRHLY